MRTTLTLDADVAVLLARVQRARHLSFKQTVNDALRQGLRQMTEPSGSRKPYRTPAVDLGPRLAGNLDDIAEVLAVAEGESFS